MEKQSFYNIPLRFFGFGSFVDAASEGIGPIQPSPSSGSSGFSGELGLFSPDITIYNQNIAFRLVTKILYLKFIVCYYFYLILLSFSISCFVIK